MATKMIQFRDFFLGIDVYWPRTVNSQRVRKDLYGWTALRYAVRADKVKVAQAEWHQSTVRCQMLLSSRVLCVPIASIAASDRPDFPAIK